MKRALVAAVLLVGAFAVHAGVTLPARRARDEARLAFAQKRAERERLRAELQRLERRPPGETAGVPGDAAAAARGLRLALLAATRGQGLLDVQISAQPERRGDAAARGRLGGTGRQADLLRTAGRLAEPASGAVLERVELAARAEGVRLELSARAAGSGAGS